MWAEKIRRMKWADVVLDGRERKSRRHVTKKKSAGALSWDVRCSLTTFLCGSRHGSIQTMELFYFLFLLFPPGKIGWRSRTIKESQARPGPVIAVPSGQELSPHSPRRVTEMLGGFCLGVVICSCSKL